MLWIDDKIIIKAGDRHREAQRVLFLLSSCEQRRGGVKQDGKKGKQGKVDKFTTYAQFSSRPPVSNATANRAAAFVAGERDKKL